MVAAQAQAHVAQPTHVSYEPRGVARALFTRKDRELIVSGPAGTGKSRACLEKLHLCACKYAGMRGFMLRKTRASLTQTGIVTYEKAVLHPLDGVVWRTQEQEYRYPNGSAIVVGGLDKPGKIMSSEFDMAYLQEATDFTENDWESITTRLRHGVMPYQQLLADCNPSAPSHWLKRRTERGAAVMLESRHEDNPRLYDAASATWTDEGRTYIGVLDALTGVRRERLRFGRWVAAEGLVYEAFDRAIHVIPRDALPPLRRYIAAVDWGYTNPGVITVWGLDGDGRMYLVREVYRSRRLIDWWVQRARQLRTEYPISYWQCDPSEPAYIQDFQRGGLAAQQGFNDIARGIQAIQARLAPAADGRPRLYVVADALDERDDDLMAAGKPLSGLDEVDSYVWPKGLDGKAIRETPVDADNHSLDTWRYAVAAIDHLSEERPKRGLLLHGAVSGWQ